MRYLSIDLEATGLAEDDLIIEFGLIPFCTETKTLEHKLALHSFIQCPSFQELKPRLDQWVIDHNEGLINKAHNEGQPIQTFKTNLEQYLTSKAVVEYFKNDRNEKIVLFGKSMNAIDLPFLNRDLGWNFMREYFHHRVLDLSSTANTLIDLGFMPQACSSGSELMTFLKMGEVAHTALEDAKNTALMYLKILELFGKKY
jgi:oligoribonuclease (3'-5' exoribonuclease)